MGEDLHTIDSANRTTILVHYYRAMVGRADVPAIAHKMSSS